MLKQLFRKKSIPHILKEAEAGLHDGHGIGLKKVLGVRDLTFFGVAAVIGAGIFSGIGSAASNGGPESAAPRQSVWCRPGRDRSSPTALGHERMRR